MRFAAIAVFYPLLQVVNRISGYPLPDQKSVPALAARDLLSLLGIDESSLALAAPGGSPTGGIGVGGQNVAQPTLPTPVALNSEWRSQHTELPTGLISSNKSPTVTTMSIMTGAGATLSTRIGIVSLSSQQPEQGFAAAPTPSLSLVGSLSGSGSGGKDKGAGADGSDDYVGQDASTTPPAELTEWKVIGIAVMTITLIGTIVLAVTFFDQWWGFLRAVLCGKRARRKRDAEMFASGGEDMVPDWNRRTWQFKLDGEYGHRYPDMGALNTTRKDEEKGQRKGEL